MEQQVELTENSEDESDSFLPKMKQTRAIDTIELPLNLKRSMKDSPAVEIPTFESREAIVTDKD